MKEMYAQLGISSEVYDFGKRAIGLTDSDNFFQGIIWFSDWGKQLIART